MDKTPYRYSIGIDLGTTNCALSYIDLKSGEGVSRILEIPQWETIARSVTKKNPSLVCLLSDRSG